MPNLTPVQAKIAKDNHRFRVLSLGRRTGKTTLAVEEIKGKALAKANRILYIANTYQQARDIAWEMLKKELKPAILSVNESRLELRVKTQDNEESLVILRGWESVDTLRGQAFNFIVIDEVASMRDFWLNWQEVLRPTLTDTRGEVLFCSTPKGFNHFYELYSKDPSKPPAKDIEQDPDYKSFHFTTYDNPFIPFEEIEKAKKELPENRFAQEYLADFRKSEGLVYKEFNREKHIFSDKKMAVNQIEKIAGIDWGYEHPSVVLEIVKDYDHNFWVMSEWYRTHKTTKEIIEYVAGMKFNAVYPDPAEPDRLEECERAGLNVMEVNKDVLKGVDTIRNLLKEGKLFIHNSCRNLINEFETYSYREARKDGQVAEEPLKENDDGVDALRYALFNQGSLLQQRKSTIRYPSNLNRNPTYYPHIKQWKSQ